MVSVKRDKTLREKPANSLFDFGRIWMNETIAEGLAGRLPLFRCLSVAELMEKSSNSGSRNEEQDGEGERTKNLDEESLRGHTDMIQENRPLRALAPSSLCLEYVDHWERIASRGRPAFSSHLT